MGILFNFRFREDNLKVGARLSVAWKLSLAECSEKSGALATDPKSILRYTDFVFEMRGLGEYILAVPRAIAALGTTICLMRYLRKS